MKFEGKKTISITISDLEYNKRLAETTQKNKMRLFCRIFSFFRSYITVFTVIFLLAAVSITNSAPKNSLQNRNVLFSHMEGKGGSGDSETIIIKNIEEKDIEDDKNKHTPIAKIATTNSSFGLDFNRFREDDSETNSSSTGNSESGLASWTLYGGNSLLAPSVYYDESLSDLKYGIIKYKVVEGDTASSIATSFGISTYTVLWANNLKTGSIIKPKQELEILPITGVKHIVKPGDTIEAIAKKYKADKEEIIIFNSLNADGIFQEGTEGKTLIIPNGEMEAPVTIRRAPTPRTINGKVVSSSKYKTSGFVNPLKSHRFAYGHCTYYVASRVYVPWSGHAKSWLANARAYGYRTGNTPAVGSIVVTTEHRWYGHVGLVEAVTGNSITISEMNYVGWNRKSVRVIPINSRVIRGYIYMK